MEESLIPIERIAVIGEPGADPTPSPYGFVIDKDGRIYSQLKRYTHGVIIALLYPELAAKHKTPAPAGAVDELNLRFYQDFEHEVSHDVPIVRIALSYFDDFIAVSKGKEALTSVQIDSVRRALKSCNRGLRDTLTGEEGDMTVGQFLDDLRQEQELERERKEAEGDA
jgi:hypothetical protein